MNARVFRPAAGALCALMLTAAAAHAQPVATPAAMSIAPPQNVLQLSANGQVEVQQDLLTLSLTTSREGADAAGVQAELRKALDAALVLDDQQLVGAVVARGRALDQQRVAVGRGGRGCGTVGQEKTSLKTKTRPTSGASCLG